MFSLYSKARCFSTLLRNQHPHYIPSVQKALYKHKYGLDAVPIVKNILFVNELNKENICPSVFLDNKDVKAFGVDLVNKTLRLGGVTYYAESVILSKSNVASHSSAFDDVFVPSAPDLDLYDLFVQVSDLRRMVSAVSKSLVLITRKIDHLSVTFKKWEDNSFCDFDFCNQLWGEISKYSPEERARNGISVGDFAKCLRKAKLLAEEKEMGFILARNVSDVKSAWSKILDEESVDERAIKDQLDRLFSIPKGRGMSPLIQGEGELSREGEQENLFSTRPLTQEDLHKFMEMLKE